MSLQQFFEENLFQSLSLDDTTSFEIVEDNAKVVPATMAFTGGGEKRFSATHDRVPKKTHERKNSLDRWDSLPSCPETQLMSISPDKAINKKEKTHERKNSLDRWDSLPSCPETQLVSLSPDKAKNKTKKHRPLRMPRRSHDRHSNRSGKSHLDHSIGKKSSPKERRPMKPAAAKKCGPSLKPRRGYSKGKCQPKKRGESNFSHDIKEESTGNNTCHNPKEESSKKEACPLKATGLPAVPLTKIADDSGRLASLPRQQASHAA